MKSRKDGGIVFSTNPNFEYDHSEGQETNTLPPNSQQLRIWIEAKGRKGKTVTIVKGFIGKDCDLEVLAKEIKTKCGSGGTVKNGEIIIQGNARDKILDYLVKKGYHAKKAGG